MAYNPFNIFRRNQKALFAVLTVFIMIMFTLSFGANDFFERATKWLGARGRGDAACKLDGTTIKDSELVRVRRARVMANTFMTYAADETGRTVKEYANQQQSKLSDDGRTMAQQASQAELYLNLSRGNPQMLDTPLFGNKTPRQTIREAEDLVAFVIGSNAPNIKSEDKDAARAFQALLGLQRHRLAADGAHFFVNAPNRTSRDTIEFLLWEKKAEQLGINFTKEDAKILLNRELYNFWTPRSDVEVSKRLREQEGFNMEACLDALVTEFKVRAAQVAVLGPQAKFQPIAAPVFSTPYEMFEYYRQQCSPATYELVAVPALAFLDKVKAEPTDAELNELYKNYQDSEPNPARESFGFKEPRKLAISWLAITGSEPYYEKLATEQLKVGEVLAKASGMTAVPLPGAGGGWAMAATAPLVLKEPAVDAAYSQYESDFKRQLRNEYASGVLFTRDLMPTSAVRPGTLAALLGGMAGQSAPFGHPAVGASIAMGAPIAYEIRDRIKVGLPLFGAIPGPGFLQTSIGAAASAELAAPKPLSVQAMRPELMKIAIKERTKALLTGSRTNFIDPTSSTEKGDLTRFIEEMEKLSDKGKPKDKAAIEKYVKEFREARGLTKQGVQFGSSTAARDEWTLEEDPGLFPLVEAQKEGLMGARGAHGGNKYVPFGRSFFWTVDRSSQSPRRVPTAGVYVAHSYPEDLPQAREEGRPNYIYWVTEEVPAKKTNAITARDTVRAAWKQLKARELASQRANAMAEAIRNSSKSDAVLVSQTVDEQVFALQKEIPFSNEKAFRRVKKFTLNDVCPLAPVDIASLSPEVLQRMFQQGFNPMGRVQPFTLTESANIPYPTMEMVNALIDNRDKPAKTVVVFADGPKDTYYVATLIRRDLKSADDFKRSVYSPGAPARDVLGNYMEEAYRKSHQSVVELLKKEFRYVETEEQKKRLDENAKSGGRD
ncbi:hypothetical protein J8F10_05080 [Gemmata sp. G18]|uniref:PpiC domain-containing protein n=1 Tax=Gemmata palustris TaxID=2822762 RepID=A0ABS5BLR6_9BACT|nr:hypothetical protein [Gemmata palustris]MBP3954655.1 hypothetical protein [Gemmata palustris]